MESKEIISREQAKECGLLKYFTGNLCMNGHICERYVSNDFCFECGRIYHKKYKEKNRKRIAARMKEWKKKNKIRHRQLNKISRERNIEKARERAKTYIQNNPSIIRVCSQNRRAREKKADGKFTKKDIELLGFLQKWKCNNCKKHIKEKYHVDHIMPIVLGGSNWPSNLQLLCVKCNMTKHAKDPFEWARENGRLL